MLTPKPRDGLVREALRRLHADRTLTDDLAESALGAILDGQGDDIEVAAFLSIIQAYGPTSAIMAGAVRAVRSRMRQLDVPERLRPLVDTCGTGGDGASTFNISTAAAIVVAACGVRVAKHGNRSASGRSGSSDVLNEMGVAIEAAPEVLVECLEAAGIAYLHAPAFHPALRRLGPIRAGLPFPTLFNLIGPLANPARPEFQVIGSPDQARRDLLAATLVSLADGTLQRAILLTSDDGLDEISLDATCRAVRFDAMGSLTEQEYQPESFGLSRAPLAALRADGPVESARLIRAILEGRPGPHRAIVLANAAIALHVAGRTDDLKEAVHLASQAIDSGAASQTLAVWARVSQGSSRS